MMWLGKGIEDEDVVKKGSSRSEGEGGSGEVSGDFGGEGPVESGRVTD
jgi:hypothetical protein